MFNPRARWSDDDVSNRVAASWKDRPVNGRSLDRWKKDLETRREQFTDRTTPITESRFHSRIKPHERLGNAGARTAAETGEERCSYGVCPFPRQELRIQDPNGFSEGQIAYYVADYCSWECLVLDFLRAGGEGDIVPERRRIADILSGFKLRSNGTYCTGEDEQ
jgi:hypothetical protein